MNEHNFSGVEMLDKHFNLAYIAWLKERNSGIEGYDFLTGNGTYSRSEGYYSVRQSKQFIAIYKVEFPTYFEAIKKCHQMDGKTTFFT